MEEPVPSQPPTQSKDNEIDFRWQALFQRSSAPIFVLNRQRRILFVNRAWERLTKLSAAEIRGLACLRRAPVPQDPPDVVVRALCCPPPEVFKGKSGRTRRPVPGAGPATRWWDVEFLPIQDENGLLGVVGKITTEPGTEAASYAALPEKIVALREAVRQRHGFEQLASNVPIFRRILEQVRVASATLTPVLIVGETGTGKHWVARTIHYQGLTSEGTFRKLDCLRLPAPALSTAFDAEFAGARTARPGTWYFAEPSRLPRDLQVCLRDLLERGDPDSGPHIITACLSDPVAEIGAGRLLEELYCAMSTLVIALPALRDRQSDMPALVDRFLARAQSIPGMSRAKGLTAQSWDLFRGYTWPGNLRELYAVLRSACSRSAGEPIDVAHLPAYLRLAVQMDPGSAPAREVRLSLDEVLEEAERRLIQQALKKARGNKSMAAEVLSVGRSRLIRRMEALGIPARSFDPTPGP
jgi:two-component system response regulator HydG